MHDDPAHCRELSAACLRLLADGAVPPLPVTTFSYADYASALRFMASGQHEGKLVLTAPDAAGLEVIDRRLFLDPAATYLVTGGLGGFGLHLLAYLVSAGARHLTLIDRDPARRRDAGWVRDASGIAHFFGGEAVEIDIVPGDVCRRADVDRCLAGLSRPLKGVFHLAAILDDHPLADVAPESVAAVFAPKAGGAWHLHEATSELSLDHFVLISSIAAVFGNAGQSVYAAANAYLDGLAGYRRGLGLPADPRGQARGHQLRTRPQAVQPRGPGPRARGPARDRPGAGRAARVHPRGQPHRPPSCTGCWPRASGSGRCIRTSWRIRRCRPDSPSPCGGTTPTTSWPRAGSPRR